MLSLLKEGIAMTPLIGISCNYDLPSGQIRLNSDYIAAITDAGGIPYPLPITNIQWIPKILSIIDGLLLSGGGDIYPSLYGRKDDTNILKNLNIQRDYFELSLMRQAVPLKMPILGICRGMQVLNVHFQGTLFLDLAWELSGSWAHQATRPNASTTHPVSFRKESRLHGIYGSLALVNSSHHQAVRKVGQGLTVTASSPDGVIEAVEAKTGHWMVGVQWHPEKNRGHYGSAGLFNEFVHQAKEYSHAKLFNSAFC